MATAPAVQYTDDAQCSLAPGHGVHYCLGASLAMLEARIAWGELLRRIPDYQIVEEPHHFVSSTFYGWEALHIVF